MACDRAECVESQRIGLKGMIEENHPVTALYVRNLTLTVLSRVSGLH